MCDNDNNAQNKLSHRKRWMEIENMMSLEYVYVEAIERTEKKCK